MCIRRMYQAILMLLWPLRNRGRCWVSAGDLVGALVQWWLLA